MNIKKGEYGQKRNFSYNMIPDSVFGLRLRKDNRNTETYFFLEADRATMPIRRANFYRSSFYKKIVGYVASHRNDLFSEYFGFKKIRVLTVTKSDERIKSMIQVNKDPHDIRNGYKLFLFTKNKVIDIDKPEKVFKRIWIDGRGKKVSLLR
ncbi:MAG: hypothetical protein HF978_21955 [Desulfobacteraceae bacterium]|nr:hypothetical protein [Desulfobacteraceae bacterium]MBC2758207.1 hypothetical protein [Desulfobacteraceae bacterium]